MELSRGHATVARPARVAVQNSLLIRPQAAVRRHRLTAAAEVDIAATAADAAPHAPAAAPPAAAAVAAAEGQAGAATSTPGDASSVTRVRVGAETNPAKVAGYILSQFEEQGNDHTVIIDSVGPPACAQALKAVARIQNMLAEDPAADRCVVFQLQSKIQRGPQEQRQQPDGPARQDDGMGFRTNQLILRVSSRSSWPDVAFNPAKPEDTRKAPDAQGRTSSSDSKSSSASKEAAVANCFPMPVRTDAADPWQRLQKHALIAAKRNVPAQFAVAGAKDRLASAVVLLLRAVHAARKEALASEEPFDLQCTIASSSYAVERDASRDDQQAAGAAAAAADAEAGAAAAADASTTLTRYRHVVTVQRCEPSRNALAAAKRRAEAAAVRGERGPGRSSGPRVTRPGFVEVREEEWNQLKEQLQVVPHLTEQLQIMTRQHEQLLTLLATQQGQQQQGQQQQEEGQE